jgi:hypothetical protein
MKINTNYPRMAPLSLMLLSVILLCFHQIQAQVAVIGAGAATSSLGSNAGPIFRSSASSTFDHSTHYYLYTATELAAAGITPGSAITALAWNKANALGTVAANTTSVLQVHMKNSTVMPGSSWCNSNYATQSGGATLVYNNTAQVIPLNTGYITLTLSSPFIYTGGSLEIGTNWNCSAHIGNPTTGGFTWKQDALANQVFGGSNSSSFITMSLQGFRPQIQISYTASPPCTGVPAPGNTIASVAMACPNSIVNLSLQNVTSENGITYQWYNGSGAVVGATASAYSFTMSSADNYYCDVTCTGSGLTTSSTPVSIGLKPFNECYCIPTTTNGCASGDHIINVTFNTINNTSGTCISGGSYSNYSSLSTNLVAGNTYTISMTVANGGIEYGAVWIDYNQSGTFDATEFTNIPLTLSGGVWIGSASITIPPNASTGVTGMRVRSSYSAPITAGSACGNYIAGEGEAYPVTISNCTNTTSSSSVTAIDSYLWSCNGTTYSASGTYTCTSFNSQGCIETNMLNLSIVSQLTVSLTSTMLSCSSCCDGSVTINPTGGSGQYSIKIFSGLGGNVDCNYGTGCIGLFCEYTPTVCCCWIGFGSQMNPSSLCAGDYTAVILDTVAGAYLKIPFKISTPVSMLVTATPATCATCCDGNVSINPNGGSGNNVTYITNSITNSTPMFISNAHLTGCVTAGCIPFLNCPPGSFGIWPFCISPTFPEFPTPWLFVSGPMNNLCPGNYTALTIDTLTGSYAVSVFVISPPDSSMSIKAKLNNHAMLEAMATTYEALHVLGLDSASLITWNADFSDECWHSSITGTLYNLPLTLNFSGVTSYAINQNATSSFVIQGQLGSGQISFNGSMNYQFNDTIGKYDKAIFEESGGNYMFSFGWKELIVYSAEIIVHVATDIETAGAGGYAAGIISNVVLTTASSNVSKPPPPSPPTMPSFPTNLPYSLQHLLKYSIDSNKVFSRVLGCGKLDANYKNRVYLVGNWSGGNIVGSGKVGSSSSNLRINWVSLNSGNFLGACTTPNAVCCSGGEFKPLDAIYQNVSTGYMADADAEIDTLGKFHLVFNQPTALANGTIPIPVKYFIGNYVSKSLGYDSVYINQGIYNVNYSNSNHPYGEVSFNTTLVNIPLTATLTSIMLSCSSCCDGSVSVNPSGGSGNYVVKIFSGNGGSISYSTSGSGCPGLFCFGYAPYHCFCIIGLGPLANATALCAGDYTAVVLDTITGASLLVPFKIATPVSLQISTNPATCSTCCDGNITAVTHGGSGNNVTYVKNSISGVNDPISVSAFYYPGGWGGCPLGCFGWAPWCYCPFPWDGGSGAYLLTPGTSNNLCAGNYSAITIDTLTGSYAISVFVITNNSGSQTAKQELNNHTMLEAMATTYDVLQGNTLDSSSNIVFTGAVSDDAWQSSITGTLHSMPLTINFSGITTYDANQNALSTFHIVGELGAHPLSFDGTMNYHYNNALGKYDSAAYEEEGRYYLSGWFAAALVGAEILTDVATGGTATPFLVVYSSAGLASSYSPVASPPIPSSPPLPQYPTNAPSNYIEALKFTVNSNQLFSRTLGCGKGDIYYRNRVHLVEDWAGGQIIGSGKVGAPSGNIIINWGNIGGGYVGSPCTVSSCPCTGEVMSPLHGIYQLVSSGNRADAVAEIDSNGKLHLIFNQPTGLSNGDIPITFDYFIGPYASKAFGYDTVKIVQGIYNVDFSNPAHPFGEVRFDIILINPPTTTLNLTCFIQGYWDGSSGMVPVLANQVVPTTLNACDSIDVEIRDALSPYAVVAATRAVLQQNGTAICSFPLLNGDYYIAVKHRNAVETWSANPVTIGTNASYNFSTAASQAYGSNQVLFAPGVWAFYSGDNFKDISESVDLLDMEALEFGTALFNYGYFPEDINGDGNVDILDGVILEENINNFIFSMHP